jgi:short-subunit dehydrogenase
MKKIIIIGATSGIGRGLAEIYSQEDFLIGITGRRENLLKEVCARDEDKLFYQVCDITDTQSTISSLETLVQKMGGMDILIICAGTGELNPKLSYQLEEPTLLTNVIGFTNIADWGFRYFERQKSGHLVTISSVGGTRAVVLPLPTMHRKPIKSIIWKGYGRKRPNLTILFIRPIFVPDL